MKKPNNNSGVSLVVATIYIAVMMLIIAGLAEVTITTLRNISNWDFSGGAESMAFGARQIAGQFATDNSVGKNAKSDALSETYAEMDDYIKFIEKFGIACAKPCVGFRIIGRTEDQAVLEMKGDNTKYNYSVPAVYYDDAEKIIKGTGSAAEECKDVSNADDPCHWNKLYVGDKTEIPLYVEDPSVAAFSQIKIRVRSPCGEFKYSESSGKFECTENVDLYPKVAVGSPGNPSPFRKIDKDKVLIHWLILGDGMVMAKDWAPKDKTTGEQKRPTPKINLDASITDENTEISAGRINDANGSAGGNSVLKDFLGNHVVLDENYSGMNLNKEPITFKKLIESKSQLKLYFNLVGTPRREDNNDNSALEFTPDQLNDSKYFLPYLEYQILTNEPIADSTTTLFGWAEISDFYKISEGKRIFPVIADPFALGNM